MSKIQLSSNLKDTTNNKIGSLSGLLLDDCYFFTRGEA